MSCAYRDNKTAIGLILGTGTNACYIENIDRIETIEDFPEDTPFKEVESSKSLFLFQNLILVNHR